MPWQEMVLGKNQSIGTIVNQYIKCHSFHPNFCQQWRTYSSSKSSLSNHYPVKISWFPPKCVHVRKTDIGRRRESPNFEKNVHQTVSSFLKMIILIWIWELILEWQFLFSDLSSIHISEFTIIKPYMHTSGKCRILFKSTTLLTYQFYKW